MTTRTKTRGLELGSGLVNALSTVYWPRYDRSSAGLSVDIAARSVRVRSLGARTIVSYVIDMKGTGGHPFHETAFVTHVLDADFKPLISMAVAANPPTGMNLGLNYTGYPSTKPATTGAKFYTNVMELGDPYVGPGYRGWWSASGLVFGLYKSGRRRHGAPRRNKPSGYMSFGYPPRRTPALGYKARGVRSLSSRRSTARWAWIASPVTRRFWRPIVRATFSCAQSTRDAKQRSCTPRVGTRINLWNMEAPAPYGRPATSQAARRSCCGSEPEAINLQSKADGRGGG